MNERHPLNDVESWKRLSPLFDQLLETAPDRRHDWLASLREHDAAAAERLAGLLAAHERVQADGFLEQPMRDTLDDRLHAGRQVGAYRLLEPLGSGGMGAVWLAERSDGRFEGKAAVKLLHGGLIRPGDHERFRREASALARLSHPNIARLVDAGVADGQPFLVLDYIDGRRIDEACESAGVDLEARIRLGLQVLDAVAHAHTRLVLHRDIKPSNVLVDADGAAKLIDFGIARLVSPDDVSATEVDVTGEFGRAFTPRFGAPEQLTGQPVGTTSDVYSIGLLLYVLLAGENPRDHVSPADVATADLPLASVVAARGGRAERARALRGDLDNILAKAVTQQPADRYATAGAFADDLRRYLAGEPVTARPTAWSYRMRKFVGRHRVAVGASAAAIAGIAALAVVALLQAREARRLAGVAVARGVAAYAVAQAPIRIDRALLLGAEAVTRHLAPETSVGLLSALDASRQLSRFVDLGPAIRVSIVSADRSTAFTIDLEGRLRRWALPEWSMTGEVQTPARTAGYVSLEYTADGTAVILIEDYSARAYDVQTLAERMPAVVVANREEAAVLIVSPDLTRAARGTYQGRTVQFTDLPTGATTASMPIDGCGGLISLGFLPNDTAHLMAGCANGVFVLDGQGRTIRRREGLGATGLLFSPDGAAVTVPGLNNRLAVLDVATLADVLPPIVVPGGRPYSAMFSHTGRMLAIGTDTGRIAVWDIGGKREVAQMGGLEEGVIAVDWLADDFDVTPQGAVTGAARLMAVTERTVSEWELTRVSALGDAATPMQLSPSHQGGNPVDRRRHQIFTRAAPAVADAPSRRISVRSTESGRELRAFDVDADDLAVSTLDGSGRSLLVSTLTGTTASLQVLDAESGARRQTLAVPDGFFVRPDGHEHPGRAIDLGAAFSSDGSRVVAVFAGHLALWDVASGRRLATASAPPMTSLVSFSPDDAHIVTTREYAALSFFDGATLADRGTVETDYARYTIKHLFPSGALGGIVGVSEGGMVLVIDPETRSLIGEPFQGGGSQLQSGAVSPDGRYLAAMSSDGSVRLWDVATRVPLGPPLHGHPVGRVYHRLWFDDDQTLSTFTPGRKIEWNLDLTAAAARACTRIGRALSNLEWRQYVGDVPYEPACRPQERRQ